MKKQSFRRLFLVYSAFYLLIISTMVGMTGYYLFQNQSRDVLLGIEKLKNDVTLHLDTEVYQLKNSLKILKSGFDVFNVQSSKKSADYFSKLTAEIIQQRDIQYNAYFALEKSWSQKYFHTDGYILTTHRNPQFYGAKDFYDPYTFLKTVYTDPTYQADPAEVWYQVAKKSPEMQFTNPYYDKTYMKEWLITASLGIYEKGKFQGMVGIDVLVDELTRSLDKFKLGETGGVLWLDKGNDQILSQSSDRLDKFIGPIKRFKEQAFSEQQQKLWRNVLEVGTDVKDFLGANGRRYIVSAQNIENTPWTVVVYQDYWEAFSPVFEKFYRICIVGILAVIFLIQLAMHVHRAIALPMEKLVASLKSAIQAASENQSMHHRGSIAVSGYVEMHRVSKLFNVLLRIIDRNTSSYFAAIELERAKSLHQAKMASLGQMASGIAHEINNPLSIINGRLVKAEKQLRNDPPEIEAATETVRSIEQIVFRIAKIVRGLRQFSREASKDPFELKSLREIIEETLELCAQRFQNHGIKIETSELDYDVIIECQTVQISQVLLNLLNNSFDAILELDEKWIKIEVQDHNETVQIRVTDSGKGIAGGTREHIMDPFFTTKEVGKGTGLGLSLSRGIIEYHQGQLFLDVDSLYTSFVIRLPKFRNYKAKIIDGKRPDWT